MKNILTTFFVLLSLFCQGQDTSSYSTAPMLCCDSLTVGSVITYSDGKPTHNPTGLQTKLVLDTTNSVLWSYSNDVWNKQGDVFASAFGIVYWNGTKWDVLRTHDHQAHNIDSVGGTNGDIIPYHNIGIDSVYFASFSSGGLASMGINLDGGYGLNHSVVQGLIAKPYEGQIMCRYTNGNWVLSHYNGAVYTNPSLISWDSAKSIIVIGHVEFLSDNVLIKVGGPNYDDFRVYEFNSGYAYNSTRLCLKNWGGATYKVQEGDWFTIMRRGKKGQHTTMNNTFYIYRISDWSFLPSPTNTFTNFQIEIKGK